MAEITLKIDGMHCGSCVRRVGQALSTVPGVTVGDVRVGAARLKADEGSATAGDAAKLAVDALAKAGYAAHVEQ